MSWLCIFLFEVVFVFNSAKLTTVQSMVGNMKEPLDNKKSHLACANYYNNLNYNEDESSNKFCRMKSKNYYEQDLNAKLNSQKINLDKLVNKMETEMETEMEIDKTENIEENLRNQNVDSSKTDSDSRESSSKSVYSQYPENDLLYRKVASIII
jgi:hypothetical protein